MASLYLKMPRSYALHQDKTFLYGENGAIPLLLGPQKRLTDDIGGNYSSLCRNAQQIWTVIQLVESAKLRLSFDRCFGFEF